MKLHIILLQIPKENMEAMNGYNFWTAVILSGTFVALLCFLSRRKGMKGRLPPSAPSLPVIGSLYHLGSDPRKPLLALKEKLGDVFTVYFGSRPVVMLNSYDAIKEAFVKQGYSFSGRPQHTIFTKMTKELGVVFTQGPFWQEQRKFTHGVFREFGMGRAALQEKIHEELVPLVQQIQRLCAKPFDISSCLKVSVSNIICSIIFGNRYEYSDPQFNVMLDIMDETFNTVGQSGVLATFPWLSKLPGDPFGLKKILDNMDSLFDHYKFQIKEHEAKYDPQNIKDFIDSFLHEQKRQEKMGKQDSTFHEQQLASLIGDLFFAGTETTATTLNWAVVYLLHHPDVQEKVKHEIEDTLGSERLPRMTDKPNLPYTEATLYEIQRMATIGPLTIPHSTMEDVKFRDYFLPQGTTVLGHLHAAHRDPAIWPNPDKFDPGRFLDSEGKVANFEKLIYFSMGKRVCLGESMARMESFLIFTTLLQRFTFKLPEGNQLPAVVGNFGFSHSPTPYKVMVIPTY